MSTPLTAQAVRDLAYACNPALPELVEFIEVEGVRRRFAFAREQVLARRAAIDELLAQLPVPFRALSYGGGGGWTFLNACVREDEYHWGEHPDVELLLALGLAVGSVEWLLPRNMWDVLPGAMPYFQILSPQLLVNHA